MVGVVALLFVAALAGMHLAGTVGMNPAMRNLDARSYVSMKQAADVSFPRLAKPLLLGGLVVTAGAGVVALATAGAAVLVLLVCAFVLLVVTLVAVLRGDHPINLAMAAWDPLDPPPDWAGARARWERFFALRTAATVAATVCTAAALVLDS